MLLQNSQLQKCDLFEDIGNHTTRFQKNVSIKPQQNGIYFVNANLCVASRARSFSKRDLCDDTAKILHRLTLDLAYKIPAKMLDFGT